MTDEEAPGKTGSFWTQKGDGHRGNRAQSAAVAHQRISEFTTSETTTVQATPTEDVTVTALSKEKLEQEVKQLKEQVDARIPFTIFLCNDWPNSRRRFYSPKLFVPNLWVFVFFSTYCCIFR